jgi:hypothetical protein
MTHPSIGQSFFNHTDLFFTCSIYFYQSRRGGRSFHVFVPLLPCFGVRVLTVRVSDPGMW